MSGWRFGPIRQALTSSVAAQTERFPAAERESLVKARKERQ